MVKKILLSQCEYEMSRELKREKIESKEELLQWFIMDVMKIDTGLTGFSYMFIIMSLYEDWDKLNMKQIYKEIADLCEVTPQSVERSVRYAIKDAYGDKSVKRVIIEEMIRLSYYIRIFDNERA